MRNIHAAGGSGIFSDSDSGVEEVVQARGGVDAFSDSSIEEKVSAVGDYEACRASSEEIMGGQDVLSDLSDGDGRGQVGMGGQEAFSDSENEAKNEDAIPAGTRRIYSGMAAADLFSDTTEESSGSEMEDELSPAGTGAVAGLPANPVVPGRFTAAYFTQPIPESWLVEDASDIE
jgi:hypothetical protein